MSKVLNQFQKDFSKGYICAVANIIRTHGEGTIAEDVFRCNSMSIKQMREIGVDESDIEEIKPIIKEINRRNKALAKRHAAQKDK